MNMFDRGRRKKNGHEYVGLRCWRRRMPDMNVMQLERWSIQFERQKINGRRQESAWYAVSNGSMARHVRSMYTTDNNGSRVEGHKWSSAFENAIGSRILPLFSFWIFNPLFQRREKEQKRARERHTHTHTQRQMIGISWWWFKKRWFYRWNIVR